jgi:hypothetical protein
MFYPRYNVADKGACVCTMLEDDFTIEIMYIYLNSSISLRNLNILPLENRLDHRSVVQPSECVLEVARLYGVSVSSVALAE